MSPLCTTLQYSPTSQARYETFRRRCLNWAIIVGVINLGAGCSPTGAVRSSAIVELNQENFQQEVLESPLPVLVEFWASWCQPCLEMKPALEQFATEHHGRIKVGSLNIDDHPPVANALGVNVPPVLILFLDGQVAKKRTGFQSKIELKQMCVVSPHPQK